MAVEWGALPLPQSLDGVKDTAGESKPRSRYNSVCRPNLPGLSENRVCLLTAYRDWFERLPAAGVKLDGKEGVRRVFAPARRVRVWPGVV